MVSTKKKKVAQRNSNTLFHEVRDRKKETTNHKARGVQRKFGASPEQARITLLENALVTQVQNPITSFPQIVKVSNPGLSIPTSSIALEIWWETYRTIENQSIAEWIHLTQEVIVGTNIICTASSEEAAREQCYGLVEELEDRFVGFMPDLGETTNVIFPMFDIESSFVQIQEAGVFILNTMWSFTWVVMKRSKS